MKTALVLFLAGLLTYASTPEERKDGPAMATWMNKPVAQLIKSWGPPTRESMENDGSRVLFYKPLTVTERKTDPRNRMFLVNKSGIVTWYGWNKTKD